jgi:hypothetical protein
MKATESTEDTEGKNSERILKKLQKQQDMAQKYIKMGRKEEGIKILCVLCGKENYLEGVNR